MSDPEWKEWLRDWAYDDETDDDPVFDGYPRQVLTHIAELESERTLPSAFRIAALEARIDRALEILQWRSESWARQASAALKGETE